MPMISYCKHQQLCSDMFLLPFLYILTFIFLRCCHRSSLQCEQIELDTCVDYDRRDWGQGPAWLTPNGARATPSPARSLSTMSSQESTSQKGQDQPGSVHNPRVRVVFFYVRFIKSHPIMSQMCPQTPPVDEIIDEIHW
jgi:hypothetical protein